MPSILGLKLSAESLQIQPSPEKSPDMEDVNHVMARQAQ